MKKPKPLINTKAISRLTELPLLFAIFLDMVGFGMVLPDIQTRLDSFGAKGWLIGGVLASYFLIQMAVSPLWGRLSDHVGRKPVLVLCGWLSAGSMAVYAFAHGINGILLSRVLAGFAAANVVVAQAYIADVTPEENRTEAMGRIGVATTAGLIFGPVIGGWLATLGGNTLLGFVAASASGLGALWIGLVVPSVDPVAQESQSHDKQKGNVLGVFHLSWFLRFMPPISNRCSLLAAASWYRVWRVFVLA
ncbi:MAG: MFS transporter [Armatimonadetes bacterium]|nr:MFS transporter [Armatimonadota bacterium]